MFALRSQASTRALLSGNNHHQHTAILASQALPFAEWK